MFGSHWDRDNNFQPYVYLRKKMYTIVSNKMLPVEGVVTENEISRRYRVLFYFITRLTL